MLRSKKKTDERLVRRTEIFKTVGEAMKALSAKKAMDWTRDTPEIAAAQDGLDNAMFEYIEGTATREEVKKAYRGWADQHIAEKGTN